MLRNVLHNDQAAIDLAYVTEGTRYRLFYLCVSMRVSSLVIER